MHRFIEIVKQRPLLIIGAVLAGALLIFLVSRKSTVAPTYAQQTPDASALAINAQLVAQEDAIRAQSNAYQMQAEVQKQQSTDTLTAALGAQNTSVTLAGISADDHANVINAQLQQSKYAYNTSILTTATQYALGAQKEQDNAALAYQAKVIDGNNAAIGSLASLASALPMSGTIGPIRYAIADSLGALTNNLQNATMGSSAQTSASMLGGGSNPNNFLSALTSFLPIASVSNDPTSILPSTASSSSVPTIQ